MQAQYYFLPEINLLSFGLLRLLGGHHLTSPLLLQSRRLSLCLLLGFRRVSVDDVARDVQQADCHLSTVVNQTEGKLRFFVRLQPENSPLKGSSAVVELANIFNMLGVLRRQRDNNFFILKILLNIYI